MTQRTDRERLDAIHQKVDAGCCGAMYLDVQFLLTRLAALEHERDELRAELTGTLAEAFQAVPVCYDTPADHYREMARRLVEDRDVQKHRARNDEAALLSLQTAWERFDSESSDQNPCPDVGLRHRYRQEMRQLARELKAALLPDPAGTIPSDSLQNKGDSARVDGEQLVDRPRTAPTERR